MKKAYIGLGSNLGDRAANLLRGISEIVQHGLTLVSISSIYETEPVENTEQPSFLNMAVAVEGSALDPYAIMKFFLETEKRMGRVRAVYKGARTIDLDLLMLDDLIIDGRQDGIELMLPHPRMHLRRFVLTPLAQIASEVEHPLTGKTIGRLLGDLEDVSRVAIYRN